MIAGGRHRRILSLMLAMLLCLPPLVGGAGIPHCGAATTPELHAHHVSADDGIAAHHAADTPDDECTQASGNDCGISLGSCVPPAALNSADPHSSPFSSPGSAPPVSAEHAPPYRPPSAS